MKSMNVYVAVQQGEEGDSGDEVLGVTLTIEAAMALVEADLRGDADTLWLVTPEPQCGNFAMVAKSQHVSPLDGSRYGFPKYHHIERWTVSDER